MKKIFLFAALAAMMSVSCNKDNGKDNGKVETLDATITLSSDLGDLTYGEPVEVKASVVSASALESFTFTAVKKNGETYAAAGSAQTYEMTGTGIQELFFPDAKDMTDLMITVKSGNAEKSEYFPVGKVTGEAKGHVYINETAQFMADNIVKNHANDPDTYPEEGTGAGSDTKSFFSMHGVEIDGKLEHILSLNQLRAVDGKNGSFCFLNCMGNTGEPNKLKNFSSQAGYMFSGLKSSSMNGGTTNRQCDLYEVNGHGIKDANIDDFTMKYVRGSWAGESYHPEIYELVDKVFLDVKSAENPYEEMKAFWQLSRIQKELDQSTLDEEIENPTSLGGKTYVRKYGNAGKSKSAIEEVFRPGDYIVIRSKRGTEETGYRYYYGIIQILSTYDDSKVFTENPWGPDYDCGSRIDPEKAEELNMKPAYFSIKCQFEL